MRRAVAVSNDVLVPNGSFESPTVSDYSANPSDTAWTYTSDSGIAANGGTYTSGNPGAPDGSQVAFIKNNGLLSQIWSASAGTYTLSFEAAQRGTNNDSYQQLRVNLRSNGGALSVKTFVWCGNQICEERDATGSTTKRYFAEGEQRIGGSDAGNYYYSRDHLGSIREVTNATGNLVTQLDYDAWGNEVVVSGAMNIDFGFTGHYLHQASGLNLSVYRAYNPTLGRWISRDPIGEAGGFNLYQYVENTPPNAVDPSGLLTVIAIGSATWDNPWGHAAIGVSGSGIYSFGTDAFPLGSSFTDYLNGQSLHRSTDVYFINTTPEQEQRILDYLKTLNPDLPKVPGWDSNDTCATRVNDALRAAGLMDPTAAFSPLFGLLPYFGGGGASPYPGSLALMAAAYSNGFIVTIPQWSSYSYGAPFTYINPR